MIDLPLYDKDGKPAGKVAVDEALFGTHVHKKVLRDVVLMYEANQRAGTHSTKTRGEIEGSGRKPWKQKHTGRARAGTVRSPLWRKGGIIFGPRPRDYSYAVPKQMRVQALNAALLSKFKDAETIVIEGFTVTEPKTKQVARLLKTLKVHHTCLIGIKAHDATLWRASRNIARLSMAPVKNFNAYDLLRHRKLVLTRDALEALVEARRSGASASIAAAPAAK
ncbi:MAG: 50S ribosomal protein L4 [Planctomycetes bacterium]|nr:50S ribosomal protein L4 [Planctomycetota bacterium]